MKKTLSFTLILLLISFFCVFFTKTDYFSIYKNEKWIKQGTWEENEIPWYKKDIKISEENGNKHLKIGVIDGPIDTNHPDFKGLNIIQKKIIETSNNNDLFHGTSVAGIIASKKNYGIESFLVEDISFYNANVMKNGIVKQEHLIEGIQWLIEQEVDIINISLDFKNITTELRDVMNLVEDQEIIVFFSAGNGTYSSNTNNQLDNKNIFYIASKEVTINRKNIIYLPGKNILSTSINNSYDFFDGSSYSTAIATGYIAKVLQSTHKNVNYEEIKELLIKY